jgi:hypothetical protein
MISKILAAAILSAILGVMLSELGFKSKRLFTVLCLLVIYCTISEQVIRLIAPLSEIAEVAELSEAANCAVKAVGAGYVFGFVSEGCTELGEGRLASAMALAGRIEVFALVLPYFQKTITLGLELLK